MLIDNQNRLELESKVLAAAFKQGIDHGDMESADFAHKALFRLIRERHLPVGLTKISGDWPTKRAIERFEPVPQTETVAEESPPVSLPPPSGAPVENFSPGNGHDLLSTPENLAAPAFVQEEPEGDDLIAASSAPINAYDLLAIPPTSTVELIHKRFLLQVRKVLVTKTKTKGVYPRKSLEVLRNLWIAHDILTDESIRADYDANVLGLTSVAKPDRSKRQDPPTLVDAEDAASLRLGELLRAAGLIDQTELEIACDMHKAMREMPFGRFLVKQDFIEEEQLEAVLLGQRFLRDGLIDLDQFQEAMETFTRSSKDLEQILLENGFISPLELTKVQDLIRTEHPALLGQAASKEAQTGVDKSMPTSTLENNPLARFEQYDESEEESKAVGSQTQDNGSNEENQPKLAENKSSDGRVIEVAFGEFEETS